MARYIDADAMRKNLLERGLIADEQIKQILYKTAIKFLDIEPTADVRPERHGHIVWKERHSGGFREKKCLSELGYTIFRPDCNKIARIDDRCTENRPYCSECGKLLGDFLSYCGNCGAKMDGKEQSLNG